MERYRDLQTAWLAEAVESPAVTTAKFKVAICHIPLYHPNWRDPKLPGGDGPINGKCATMTRPCALRWRPLLEKAGVNLVVSGHTHRFRHYAPDAERPCDRRRRMLSRTGARSKEARPDVIAYFSGLFLISMAT